MGALSGTLSTVGSAATDVSAGYTRASVADSIGAGIPSQSQIEMATERDSYTPLEEDTPKSTEQEPSTDIWKKAGDYAYYGAKKILAGEGGGESKKRLEELSKNNVNTEIPTEAKVPIVSAESELNKLRQAMNQ